MLTWETPFSETVLKINSFTYRFNYLCHVGKSMGNGKSVKSLTIDSGQLCSLKVDYDRLGSLGVDSD